MDLLQEYNNISDKVKEYIKTELEKKYKDVEYDDDCYFYTLCLSIKNIVFNLLLLNSSIYICYYDDCRFSDKKVETFDELFKYIDDVISEED